MHNNQVDGRHGSSPALHGKALSRRHSPLALDRRRETPVNAPDFDVAFSFAGEQRVYAEDVYNILTSRGIRVFYDGGHAASLCGKDLYQYLTTSSSGRGRKGGRFLQAPRSSR
jgi:hypothetical protein